jgi:co-chaperonin GroES (HSP10)
MDGKISIKPFGERLVVEVIKEEEKKSGKLLFSREAKSGEPILGKVVSEGELQGKLIYFSAYGYDSVLGYAVVPVEFIICYKED